MTALTARPELYGARFLFDRGGVGRAVGDMLYRAYRENRLECSRAA